MRIGPLEVNWNKEVDGRELWKRLKDSVDQIIEGRKDTYETMKRMMELYKGNLWGKYGGSADINGLPIGDMDSRAYINFPFSVVESVAPLLTDSKPIGRLVAREPYMSGVAEVYSKAIEYFWDKERMQTTLYRIDKNGLICGNGILKIWYDPVREEIETRAVTPWNFFIAEGYDDLWKAPMCGTREKVPMMWVKEQFPDVKKILTSDGSCNISDYTDDELLTRMITVYEVWMKDDSLIAEELSPEEEDRNKNNRVKEYPYGKIVYMTDHQPLGEVACPWFHGKPPYVSFVCYDNPGEFWGFGEIHQIEGIVKELNLVLQKLSTHTRSYSNTSYFCDESVIKDSEEVKDAITQGGKIVMVDLAGGQKQVPLIPMIKDRVSSDDYNLITLMQRMLEEISGRTDITKGRASKAERQSATESMILSDNANTRIRQLVRNSDDFVERVIYLIGSLMQQYYGGRDFVISGEKTDEYYRIGNTYEDLLQMIIPSEVMKEIERNQPDVIDPDLERYLEDGERFKAAYGGQEGDTIMWDFHAVVGSMSSLPMDRQTRAQVLMNLAKMNKIPVESLYEGLGFADPKDIADKYKAEQGGKR